MGADRVSAQAPSLRQSGGFTLLELLIAIAVFALIATACYRLLKSVTRMQESSTAVWEHIGVMQRARLVLEKDLLQIAMRPIRDESGRRQPALVAGQDDKLLEFTRSGWRNMTGELRSDLQRVSYKLHDHRLIRSYWPVLDRGIPMEPVNQMLMEDVDAIHFRFRDSRKRWYPAWPPQSGKQDLRPYMLPALIEVVIEHSEYGYIRMQLPGVSYEMQLQTKQVQPSSDNGRNG